MSGETHIAFIHQRQSWYLPYALEQARSANPGKTVTLISDKNDFRSIRTESLAQLQQNSRARIFFGDIGIALPTQSASRSFAGSDGLPCSNI